MFTHKYIITIENTSVEASEMHERVAKAMEHCPHSWEIAHYLTTATAPNLEKLEVATLDGLKNLSACGWKLDSYEVEKTENPGIFIIQDVGVIVGEVLVPIYECYSIISYGEDQLLLVGHGERLLYNTTTKVVTKAPEIKIL